MPRLVDLIRVNDPKFLTAFYYSLRNTLVGNDLEQATRIAYAGQRNRVVTLQGQIIETSGTMSGGGQPLRGRMGSKLATIVEEYCADALKQMQEAIKVDETTLRQLTSRRQELEALIEELRIKLDKARNNLVKWQNELSTLKEQIKLSRAAEAKLVKIISQLTPDADRQRVLEERVDDLRAQFEKSDEVAGDLRDENDELHKKIVEIKNKILDEPKANVRRIEKRMADAKEQITALQVEIKSAKRNLGNSEKKLATYNEDLEQAEANLTKYEERLKAIDESGKKLVELHETVKQECENLEEEVRQLSKAIKENENKAQKLEADRIDLNHNLQKHNEQLGLETKKVQHFEQLLSALKLHNIDELQNLQDMTNGGGDTSCVNSQYELKKYDTEDFEGVSEENMKREIHRLEENLKDQTPNLTVIEKYKELVSIINLFYEYFILMNLLLEFFGAFTLIFD